MERNFLEKFSLQSQVLCKKGERKRKRFEPESKKASSRQGKEKMAGMGAETKRRTRYGR